jgi:hypothetical protein
VFLQIKSQVKSQVKSQLFDRNVRQRRVYPWATGIVIGMLLWSGQGISHPDPVRANPQLSAAPVQKILSGRYWIGGTGMTLVVEETQYYYSDESGRTNWRPISRLRYVKDGVLRGEGHYWCLTTLPGPKGVCTSHGWMRDLAVKDLERCSRALTAAQDKIRRVKDLASVHLTSLPVPDRYPDHPMGRPDGYQFLMSGRGGFTILAAEKFMMTISTDIIKHCPSTSLVEWATVPEGAAIYGLVKGRVRGFDCYEDYNTRRSPNPKPPWGYEGCL